MSLTHENNDSTQHTLVRQFLRELGIPVHRKGYRQLTIAILLYLQDENQSLTKEIYPRVSKAVGNSDWRLVERDSRSVIQHAWEHRDPDVWSLYFPQSRKTPSNKLFITTLAERLH